MQYFRNAWGRAGKDARLLVLMYFYYYYFIIIIINVIIIVIIINVIIIIYYLFLKVCNFISIFCSDFCKTN